MIDWVSQALLWVYFEDKSKELYKLSIRGAHEVASLIDDERAALATLADPATAPEDRTDATERVARIRATIAEIVAIVGGTEGSVRTTLLEVAEDPYTAFLRVIWK